MEAFACVGECVFLAACPKVLAAFFPISFSAQYFYSCNMLVSMAFFVEKNLAVLHVCVFFFLITLPLSSALGYRCRSGFWNIFSMSYRPPTVSLFHLKSRPYPFQTSSFLKGRTLSSAPYLTKLMSVSYQLPFFHPRLSQCITTPMFALLILFQKIKKMEFSMDTEQITPSVTLSVNLKEFFPLVCMSMRN